MLETGRPSEEVCDDDVIVVGKHLIVNDTDETKKSDSPSRVCASDTKGKICGGMSWRPPGRGGGLTNLGRTEGQERDLFSVMKWCFGYLLVMSHKYMV
jgi:hypothetical protein